MLNNYPAAPEEENNPFNPQLEHFNFICGHVLEENKFYKKISIGAVIALILSVAVTFYAASLPASIPVLVTMNEIGETKYIGEISRRSYQNFQVPELAVTAVIKDFLDRYWTLSTDAMIMNRNLETNYKFLTPTTSDKFNALIKETELFADFGDITREVTFDTEPMRVTNDTYQVDMKVSERSLQGQILKSEKYRALVSVKTMRPDDDDIKVNPLGIYITQFDIKLIEK